MFLLKGQSLPCTSAHPPKRLNVNGEFRTNIRNELMTTIVHSLAPAVSSTKHPDPQFPSCEERGILVSKTSVRQEARRRANVTPNTMIYEEIVARTDTTESGDNGVVDSTTTYWTSNPRNPAADLPSNRRIAEERSDCLVAWKLVADLSWPSGTLAHLSRSPRQSRSPKSSTCAGTMSDDSAWTMVTATRRRPVLDGQDTIELSNETLYAMRTNSQGIISQPLDELLIQAPGSRSLSSKGAAKLGGYYGSAVELRPFGPSARPDSDVEQRVGLSSSA
ncbi:hypothetical protein CCMSSC00406_0008117 [Pleurotus cornucopiae]|uniref:Uncharacterized protein n=1 Tax=Pleurotus cornucopiae TaxID=5321 RepID=A0ACB7IKS2_PLECO|nr:hypothetical protein CCMSSC00406_0008117 [Pleurotus cornucopiae]